MNLYPFAILKLNSVLRLETRAFWISELVHHRSAPTWRFHTGLCKFLRIISTNIWSLGKRTGLNLEKCLLHLSSTTSRILDFSTGWFSIYFFIAWQWKRSIVAGAEFCHRDQSHEFKPVWIRATYRSDKISKSSVVASCVHFRQQVAATKYKWTNERASYGQPYWIRKLDHIPPHTRSQGVHRTVVVSQRLVLHVVHMEQLVAKTCHCDLSPSVSRPYNHGMKPPLASLSSLFFSFKIPTKREGRKLSDVISQKAFLTHVTSSHIGLLKQKRVFA